MSRIALAALAASLTILTPAGAQTTWTANPQADAFVTTGPTNNLTTSNYGAAGAEGISGASATRTGTGFRGLFDTVMRFDLSGAKTALDATYGAGLWTVQSITLRLTTTSTNNTIFNNNSTGQFSLVWMQDDTWTEGTGTPMAPTADGITYATLPGYLGASDQAAGTFTFNATTSGTDGTNTTYTLTLGSGLRDDVLNGNLASFEFLAASDSVSYLFNSGGFTTASRRPLLTITASAVPEPASWLLLTLGALALLVLRRKPAPHAPR
jgi:hypothetical protein